MNNWTIIFSEEASETFLKLDKNIQRMIQNWMAKHLMNTNDPRLFGKPIKGNFKGFWRYRVGDYRLICNIKDYVLTIYIVSVGHRKDIYK